MNKALIHLFIILIIATTISSCVSHRVYHLMGKGEVVESDYKVTVPFEMRMGLIIVKVTIRGNEYDFLFDTGAPNVVTTELGEKLNLKSAGKTGTRDSQGERHNVHYANIDTLQLGGINYTNTTAAIMDLSLAVVIECLDIDGILGANTMRNSIWQIDYQKQEIIITNTTDSLNFTSNLDTIPFTPQHTGTPKIKVQVGNVTQSGVTLDSGSGGNIDLNYKTYKETKKRKSQMPTTFGYGSSSSGVYGMGKPDTLVYFKPDTIQVGTVFMKNKIVYATKGRTASTLGTRFLENYIITLDWGRNQIVLDSVSEYDNTQLENFGYKTRFENNQLKIGFLFNSSSSGSKKLQLNDIVLKIDTVDYTTISKSEYCKMILDTTTDDRETKIMTIKRDSVIMDVPLVKTVILE